jgi:hypothetical protein
MPWKNLKETFNINNKRSIISKARFTMPDESHFNKKTLSPQSAYSLHFSA